MLKRRSFLLGAASIGLLPACGKPRKIQSSVHAGVDFKQLVPKDPDPALPLIVAIHGLGGAPEHWVDGWMPFPGRATIALPRGFDRHENGFRWFEWNADLANEKLTADVAAAEERLWKGIVELAGSRRVIVAGFSEGAILSYVMAVRHPDVIVRAFPVAGACPPALLPKKGARTAPITAFHGTVDDIIPIEKDRATAAAFRAEGNEVELAEYPGVRHSATDEMHAKLFADMQKALEAGRR